MVGQRLAHYQITAKLGEGGMGVVYRATDSKLGREVAVKVLPASVANDAERLSRLEREARTLASLNHPHIAAIYGVEEGALVMELVEGTTLFERIRGGALLEDEAIGIAKQIAEALEAAHEKGIIHRDLKPANVKITPEGVVKLLDFGLAKAIEGDTIPGDVENSPTRTRQASMTGVILGTAGYMAPEQARGLKVDRRADIWAFGVVLYEMLTGRSLFEGETLADRMAAVLTKDPDVERAPARVRPLLRRCLERDPRKRLGWIGDARFEMEKPPVAAAGATTQRARLLVPAMAVGLVAAVAGNIAFLLRKPATEDRPVRRFTIAAPGLTDGPAGHVQISPDGKRIAFVSGNRLWLREMDREEARQIADSDVVQGPFWSPDSRSVGYYSRGRIWKTPVDIAAPIPLCAVLGTFYGGSWSGDGGTIAFSSSRGVHTVAASGGESRLVLPTSAELGPAIVQPNYLPAEFGQGALLIAVGTQFAQRMFLIRVGTREKLALGEGNRPFYSPDGHVLFSRGTQIYAAAYSPSSPGTLGPPFPLNVEGTLVSVARDGTMVTVARSEGLDTRLVVRDRQGKQMRVAGSAQYAMRHLSVSRDGRRAAVVSSEQGSMDVWIHDLERVVKSRLTFDPGTESYPRFSPDGRHVAYSSTRSGNADVLSQLADGSGEVAAVLSGPEGEFSTDWSSDGNYIIVTKLSPKGTRGIYFVRRKPEGGWSDAVAFHDSGFDMSSGRVSPNGNFLAYRSQESGESAIYVRPFPSGTGKWQVSAGGAVQPRWSRDGREVYFLAGDVLMATKVSANGQFTVGATERLFSTGSYEAIDVAVKYDVLTGGEFILIEPVESQAQRPQVIHVVENWLEAFRPRNGE